METVKKLGLALIIINILFCGCSNKGSDKKDTSPKQKQLGTEEEGDKIPEQLESIEKSIESIIKTLDGPAVEVKRRGEQEEPEDREQQDIDNKKPQNNDKMQNPINSKTIKAKRKTKAIKANSKMKDNKIIKVKMAKIKNRLLLPKGIKHKKIHGRILTKL